MAEKTKNLEALMKVTSVRSWILLWTLGAVLAGVIVWSIVGSMPERIEGRGMLQTRAGTQQIAATGDGIIGTVHIREGATVNPGTPVAEIKSGRVDAEYQAAVARLQEAERSYEATRASTEGNIAVVQSQIAGQQAELQKRQDELALQQRNLRDKIVTADVVAAAERSVKQAQTELSGMRIRLQSYRDSIAQSYSQVESAKADLKRMEDTLTEVTQVTSPIAGRVTRLLKRPGDAVNRGQAIAEVESAAGGDALEVIAYISASNGRRVIPGQPVRLALNGVPVEEFGYLLGEVESVSQYPVAAEVAQRVLKEDVVSGPSYVVKIRPLRDGNRYRWGGQGNDQKVLSGTGVNVSVQVAERTPYTLVIPKGKEDRVPVAKRPSTTSPGSSN